MISPTVGRVVHYFPQGGTGSDCEVGKPHAAIICKVWSDRMVNLVVFGASGIPHPITSVRLIQPNDESPGPNVSYCQWMDYQLGQAARTEAAEKKLASAQG